MKFMLLVKADKSSDEGVMPTKEELVAMGKYNEELVKAGILLAADGLHPTSAGARVGFSGGNSTVTDGPFTETKELIAGYWVIQAKTKEEAIEWARRVPFQDGEIEVRQVFDVDDLGDAATPEIREAERRLRAQVAEQQ
jgi:hypothetical protein